MGFALAGWTLQQVLIGGGVLLSSILASLAVSVFVVVKIPKTYFVARHRSSLLDKWHPAVQWAARVLKNLAGALLVFAGVALSVPGVPGQGMLTVLLGLMLLDYPGKRRHLRWLISRRRVRTLVNRLRQRFGKPPLVLE